MSRWLHALALSFLCGSLPFSLWLTRLLLHRDVRRYGDGNPGAMNAFRAGGQWVGLLALVLDISKAAAPVGWAYFELGYGGLPMFLIAMAPLLGHAFSPFLGLRGGKALAVTLGVWIGLTLWKIPAVVVPLVILWNALLDRPGWAVVLALAGIAVVLLTVMVNPLLLAVLVGQVVILAWTHRSDLRHIPHLRPWATRWLHRVRH
jgi:acyl phosphate:glycerol-3-phosphate acyltransferase